MARRPKALGERTVLIGMKIPTLVNDALTRAAAADFELPAAYVRRALIERLRREGHLAPVQTAQAQEDE